MTMQRRTILQIQRPEILSPAGSSVSLRAAVAAGADAVYVGGRLFGARAYAENPEEGELLEAIDYAHLHGRKVYLTVNTLLKEKEMEGQLYDFLLPYYCRGLDAVLVQDVGVLRFIRRHFPELPVHASTQMTVTGADGVRFLERQGVKRVVLARELSLEEIRGIVRETGAEIECFVHGALCYCYSGQCLLSSFLGGRSGNRGRCAQPCRLPYQIEGGERQAYLMSLKDLCALDWIPELVEAGIASFKIEGRMKKPEYVAAVTAAYRSYLDQYLALRGRFAGQPEGEKEARLAYRVEERDRRMLLDLYNRGGAHSGYYFRKNGREMVTLDRPSHAGVPAVKVQSCQGTRLSGQALIDLEAGDVIELSAEGEGGRMLDYTCAGPVKSGGGITIPLPVGTRIRKGSELRRIRSSRLIKELEQRYLRAKVQEKIKGSFRLAAGEPAVLEVSCGQICVKVEGETAQEAHSQPACAQRVRAQLEKTGETPFLFEELEIQLEGQVFFPVQSLNALRRRALEELEERILQGYRREEPASSREERRMAVTSRRAGMAEKGSFTASVCTLEQLEVLIQAENVRRIYVDCAAFPRIWEDDGLKQWTERAHREGKELYLTLPYIFREETRGRFERACGRILGAGWDGALVRNLESFQFLWDHDFTKPIRTDYNLYQWNRYACEFWREQGAAGFTAPLELTARELSELDLSRGEILVYGYLPLMVSAGCVRSTAKGCRKGGGQTVLLDRYRKRFVVKQECDYCYNILYNPVPLCLADLLGEARMLGSESLRLLFTREDGEQVRKVLALYEEGRGCLGGEFTRGHWKKGVK